MGWWCRGWGELTPGLEKADISILSGESLAEVRGMKQRNLAVELPEKPLKGELAVCKRELSPSRMLISPWAPRTRTTAGAPRCTPKEASDGQITESTTVDDLANIDFGLIHALTGPIYAEGASPGNVLAVTIHEVEVSGWGWATILPSFGFLADEFTEPWISGFTMEPGATEVRFNDDISLPLAPFAGVLGVSAFRRCRSPVPPCRSPIPEDSDHLGGERRSIGALGSGYGFEV